MNVANSFPLPIGVTTSFAWGPLWQLISGVYQTPNFTLTDKGLWTVTVNFLDQNQNGDQVILNSTTGAANTYAGPNTALITLSQSGYYSLAVPQGGLTYNFTSANPIKLAAVTSATGGVLGP